MERDERAKARPHWEQVRGFAFDLDGTIWAGPTLLARRRRAGGGSSRGRAGRGVRVQFFAGTARRCWLGGLPRWASWPTTGMWLRRSTWSATRFFVVWGLSGSCRWEPATSPSLLESAGHKVLPIDEWADAQAVVVGNDPRFDFGRLRAASRAVAAGAAFFAVNMDARFPVAEDQFDPGCGALAEAIAVASGVRPISDRQAQSAPVRGHDRTPGP